MMRVKPETVESEQRQHVYTWESVHRPSNVVGNPVVLVKCTNGSEALRGVKNTSRPVIKRPLEGTSTELGTASRMSRRIASQRGGVSAIKCTLHAVVNSLSGLGSCPLVWHMHGVCCTDIDLRVSGKYICFCHEVIHGRASGVLRVV